MIRCGLFCSTFWADLKILRIIRETQTSDMPTMEASKRSLSPTWSCSLELKAGIKLSGSFHRSITGIRVLDQVAVYQLTAADATKGKRAWFEKKLVFNV
ncbi:hypothetical protein AVEN_120062-1 [Araneus ventricosus]|uniref:Uncharacterized protein n=1 Tax=Araneus ventricosus TaxID=182803 RepID=A0A4Y2JJ94_ARAVE|nr:hypothetical protein AVEN_120062-1 [Araneus ventricosus]